MLTEEQTYKRINKSVYVLCTDTAGNVTISNSGTSIEKSKQRKQKRNKWSEQSNKERGKEKNCTRYKILQQTQQSGNVIHQIRGKVIK